MARFLRTDTNSSGGHSRLRRPGVPIVGAGIAFHGPGVRLAPPLARNTVRNARAFSRLDPPAVVGAGISFHGPRVRLVDPLSANRINRRRADSRLSPPAVVTPSATQTFSGPKETLARIRPRRTDYRLAPPAVVNTETFTPCAFTTDTFNRADQDPIAGSWRVPSGGNSFESGRIFNNTYRVTTPFLGTSAFANAINMQGRWQAAITVNLDPAEVGSTYAFVGAANDGLTTTALAYAFQGEIDLILPGETYSYQTTVVPGDQIALACTPGASSRYEVWHKPGAGAWQKVLDVTSSAADWAAAGPVFPYIGIGTAAGVSSIDDFSFCPYTNDGVTAMRATQRRGVPKSRLSRPAVVTPAVTPIFTGPEVKLAPSSRLGRKAESRLQPPEKPLGALIGGVAVQLAYSRRGKPKSELAAPRFDIQPNFQGGVAIQLAPSFRGKPKSRLSAPAVVNPASTEVFVGPKVKLAKIRPARRTHYVLPQVVYSAAIYAPIAGYLTKPRDTSPTTRAQLFAPEFVGPGVTFQPVATTLTYSLRGKPKSKLKAPTVVTPIAILLPLGVQLAPTIRRGSRYQLFAPEFVDPGVVFRPVRVKLAPSFRGKATYHVAPPVVVTTASIAREISVTLARIRPQPTDASVFKPIVVSQPQGPQGGLGIQLAPASRGKTKSLLRPPIVVASGVTSPPIKVRLTLSSRLGRRALSGLGRPIVLNANTAFPQGPMVQYAPQSRGRAKSRLSAPAVVTPATRVFFGPKVELAKIKPTRTVSRLEPPVVVAPVLARPAATSLAYSSRGEPKPRLAPPVVVGPVLAQPIQITLARIKPAAIHSILRRPADLVDAADLGFIREHLAYSRRGTPKSRLEPPTVVSPVLARPISTHFIRITPARVDSVLRRPVDLIDQQDVGFVRVHLAYSLRGKPKAHLSAPTVVAPVLAAPIGTTLVRIRPVATRWLLRKPVDLVDAQDLGFVSVTLVRIRPPHVIAALRSPVAIDLTPQVFRGNAELTYSVRGKPKSRIQPPAVVTQIETPVTAATVALARIAPPRTHSFIRGPVVVNAYVADAVADVTLAYSLRGKAKSTLRPPAVVAPVLAPPIFVELAPSSRGIPKSRLEPPAVVAPVLARPIATRLSRITPPPTNSVLRRPVDLVDAQDLGVVATSLAYSLRGEPKSKLSAPAAVAPVLARAIATKLVRITPSPTMARLLPPVDLVDQQDLGFVRTHLAYSLRGRPKSRLALPTVVAPVLARPVATKLTRIRPVATRWLLGPPVDLVDQQDIGALRAHLAYSLRGKPKSRLVPPTVIAPVLAPPILVAAAASSRGIPKSRLSAPVVVQAFRIPVVSVALAPSSRGKTKPFLGRPTDLVDSQDLGIVRAHLAPGFRGAPKSRLRSPTAVFPFFARPTDVTLVRIKPVPTQYFLGRPTDLVDREDLGFVRAHLAYSLRGKPKSFLRAPSSIDLTPQVYYPAVSLAYSRRGTPKSHLPQASLYQPQPKAEYDLRVALAYSSRGEPKSRLNPPTVVTAATPYLRSIETTLVRIRPPRTIWRLGQPADTVGPEDQGSVAITLAYSERGKAKSFLRGPVVVSGFVFRGVDTTLAPSRFPRPKSVLRNPVVVQTFRIPVITTTLVRITTPPVHSNLGRPIDLVDREDLGFTRIHLAYGLRGNPKSKLRAPAFVAPVLARAIDITLAPQKRGLAKSKLRIPSVVSPFFARPTDITLARIRPVATKTRLRRPIDLVDRDDLGFARVHLAYSKRGIPKSILRKPTAVAPVLARSIEATFVRIRPVHTLAILRLPTVVTPRVEDAVADITLAYSLRGKAKSRLSAPTEVFPFFPRALDATFTQIRPVPVHSVLGRPTDLVDQADLGYIQTSLTQIRPVRTISRLSPPAIVFAATPADAVIDSTLVAIRPPAVHSILGPPAVIGDGIYFRGILVRLAPSSRGIPKSFLRPESKFAPRPKLETVISTTLAYSLRGRPKSHLTYTKPYSFPGFVCSEVLDLSEVCGDTTDLSGILQGAVLDENSASGEDLTETKVAGENLDIYHADGEVI